MRQKTQLIKPKRQKTLLCALFFLSGLVSLIYQILWLKELRLLFGNTAQAAATTLIVFFLGLGTGSWVASKWFVHFKHPLRCYALLEGGIILSAFLYFILFDTCIFIFQHLFPHFAEIPILLLLTKFLLSLLLLFPSSFFMGGTWPLLTQYLTTQQNQLGSTSTLLYTLNTLGASLGALLAGFYLPPLLGYSKTYQLAIFLNIVLASLIYGIYFFSSPLEKEKSPSTSSFIPLKKQNLESFTHSQIKGLVFLSGFATIALEVLWTHMFAQVVQNSSYTYSIVVITYLYALAASALLAHILIRKQMFSTNYLFLLLALSSFFVGLSPFLFHYLTNGLDYYAFRTDWNLYILRLFFLAGVLFFPPILFLGSIFPLLLKQSESLRKIPGEIVGSLATFNIAGTIFGSFFAGFIFLDFLGLWSSIHLISILILFVLLLVSSQQKRIFWQRITFLFLLLFSFWLNPSHLPLVKIYPLKKQEHLLKIWESSAGIVAVIKQKKDLRIKVNNYYTLGSTKAYLHQRRQSRIPLLLHPKPDHVFYLGVGTGITASEALAHPVKEITICELVPAAIWAAKAYFKDYLHGLFEDQRTKIIFADGRNYLKMSPKKYDVILSDLFIPWKEGSSSLYALEHFQNIHQHLNEGGLFAQWLPLFQLSEEEFKIIAHTMCESFPLVTLWRGDFFSKKPIVALIGHQNENPLLETDITRMNKLQREVLKKSLQKPASNERFSQLSYYCGNLTAAKKLIKGTVLNTDDFPIIEFQSPITHRQARIRKIKWFVAHDFLTFLEKLQHNISRQKDPYLQQLNSKQLDLVRFGYLFHKDKIKGFDKKEQKKYEKSK